MKLHLQLVKKDFSQDGGCLGGFEVWMMLMFCLCPDMITERSCLCFDPPWSCLDAGVRGPVCGQQPSGVSGSSLSQLTGG